MQTATDTGAAVRIRVLGGFSVTVRGDRCVLPTRKVEAVLAYLAAHLEKRIYRPTLAGIIWPNTTPEAGRHSLNQAIYSLRHVLPDLTIEGDRDYVMLSASSVTVDSLAFLDAIHRGAFRQAEQYFNGQFLEGVAFQVSDDYYEWVEETRSSLAHVAVCVFEHLLERPMAQARDDSTERVAIKLLQLQPDSRIAIAALASCGSAWSTFPGKESGVHLPADSSVAGRLPFMGRDAEIRAALTHLGAVSSSAQVMFVIGPQGVGKTRLAEQVMRIAAIRGARVYSAGSDPDDQRFPFSTVHSLLDALEAEGPPSRPCETQDNEKQELTLPATLLNSTATRLIHALDRIAAVGPTVICIDDFQWADRASRTTLVRCVRQLGNSPILFMICSRSERARYRRALKRVEHSIDRSATRVLHLRGLNDDVVERLLNERARRLGVTLTNEMRTAVVRTTKGHPLFLSETIATLSTSEVPFSNSAALQLSLEGLLLSRLKALPRDGRRVVRALAAIGRRANIALIAKVSALPRSETMALLRLAVKAGLVERKGIFWSLAHDMVRIAVYGRTSQHMKQVLHQRIANELQATGGEFARIAVHSARAGAREAAFEAAMRAADEVKPLEWLGGADYFLRLAIENAPTSVDRFRASWRLAAYLMFAHRFPAAQQVWSECASYAPEADLPIVELGQKLAQMSRAAERADHPASQLLDSFATCLVDTEMLTRLAGSAIVACSCIGNVALDQGRTDVLLKLVEVLQNIARIAGPHTERSAAAGLVATLLCHVGRVDESIAWSTIAVEEARLTSDNLALVRAQGAQGACLMFQGRPREAMLVMSECRQRAKETGLAEIYASTVLNYVVAILDAGELDRVDEVIEDVRDQLAAEWGHRQIYVHMNLAFIRYEQGFYREAERLAAEVLLENAVLGSKCIHSNAWGVLGLCALQRNDSIGVQHAHDEVIRSIEVVLGTADCTYPLLFLGRYWEGHGDTSKAIARLGAAVEFTSTRYRTCWALLRTELSRLHMRIDRPVAIKSLGELEDWAACRGCGLVLAHVHRARRNLAFPSQS